MNLVLFIKDSDERGRLCCQVRIDQYFDSGHRLLFSS